MNLNQTTSNINLSIGMKNILGITESMADYKELWQIICHNSLLIITALADCYKNGSNIGKVQHIDADENFQI